MVLRKGRPQSKDGFFRRFSSKRNEPQHQTPLPSPPPPPNPSNPASVETPSTHPEPPPSKLPPQQPKSLSPAAIKALAVSAAVHTTGDPNHPAVQQHRLVTSPSVPTPRPDRPVPSRAMPKSPAQLAQSASPSNGRRNRSPAQMHLLKLSSSGNDPEIAHGQERCEENNDDLMKKRSLSPANPGYKPLDQMSYGTPMKRRKALLIGISYRNHKKLEELPGCINDVKEMFKLLTGDLFGFPLDQVKVLSDDIEKLGRVNVDMPTRSNILRYMKWLTDDVKSGDSVVFFFAGHGDYMEDVSGDEVETGFDQCIMPVDFMPPPKHGIGTVPFKGVSPILDDTIYERLVRAVPSGAKVTAIVDACRSGTVCDLPVVYDDEGHPRYRNGGINPPRESRSPHRSAGGCVLFSGSADHQLSVDMTIPQSGPDGGSMSFGVMTRSFVDAMKDMARDRDLMHYKGVESWTYGKLFTHIKELVRYQTTKLVAAPFEVQEPQLSSSHRNVWEQPFTI